MCQPGATRRCKARVNSAACAACQWNTARPLLRSIHRGHQLGRWQAFTGESPQFPLSHLQSDLTGAESRPQHALASELHVFEAVHSVPVLALCRPRRRCGDGRKASGKSGHVAVALGRLRGGCLPPQPEICVSVQAFKRPFLFHKAMLKTLSAGQMGSVSQR